MRPNPTNNFLDLWTPSSWRLPYPICKNQWPSTFEGSNKVGLSCCKSSRVWIFLGASRLRTCRMEIVYCSDEYVSIQLLKRFTWAWFTWENLKMFTLTEYSSRSETGAFEARFQRNFHAGWKTTFWTFLPKSLFSWRKASIFQLWNTTPPVLAIPVFSRDFPI